MDKRRLFGNACEIAAARFLERKGYKILAHQFKTRIGEIDLIADQDGELVFVEVKARRNTKFGYPEEAVDARKLRKMVLTAETYMEQNQIIDKPFRLDIIAMLLKGNNNFEIEHLIGVDVCASEC